MDQRKYPSDSFSHLRTRAENRLDTHPLAIPDLEVLPREDLEQMLRELLVNVVQREIYIEDLLEAQQATEHSRHQYSDLYDFAPVAYFTLNNAGLVQDVNIEGAKLVESDRGSLLGEPFSRFVHSDDEEIYSSHLKEVFEHRSKQTCQIRLVRNSGSVFYGQLRTIAVTDPEDRPTLSRVVVTDITDYKKSEQALRESEQRYRELVNLSPDGIGVYNNRGDMVFVNETLARVLCYKPRDLIGKSIVDIVYQDSREVEVRRIRELIDKRILQPFIETVWVRADGTPVDVEVASASISFHGEPAVLMVVRDITERRKAEEKLRQSELRFRHVYESVPIMMHSINKEGKIVSVNRKWLEVLGYTREEVVGQEVESVMTAESQKTLQALLPGFWSEGRIANVPYQYVKKDGTIIDALLDSVAMDDPEWSTVSLSAIRDITARKRAEQELQKRTIDLSERIKELNCLYGVSKIVENQNVELADMFSGIVNLIPPAWQRPQDTCARIVMDGREFRTDNFHQTEWKQSSTITVHGEPAGTVDVYYLGGSSLEDDQPFSNEEQRLLDAVAERLGRIIERKEAEQAQRLSEERFRAIFESAEEYIAIKDRDLKHTLVNPAMERLLGRSRGDIVGLNASDLFGKAAGAHMEEVDLRVLGGESVDEERTIPVHGIPLTLHFTHVPLRDAGGAVIGICTTARDITERKRTAPEASIHVEDYPSHAMQATIGKARVAADTDSIVLLLGESGSGKDYLARWIHDHSQRAGGPFFAINCAAVARELAESELFGHERGAFTGAASRKKGILELAEGGTLLLNEIGELDLALQAKLLAFLDTRSFLRVGGQAHIHVNARLIAATHRDLDAESAEGRFLRPLLYRLSVFPIDVPSLRERLEDIPLLVEEIILNLASEMQLSEVPVIDSDHVRILRQYHWPGNVRELRNVLERSLMLWEGETFQLTLPASHDHDMGWSYTVRYLAGQSLRDVTDEVRKSLCAEVLRRCHGNKKKTARQLGISRDALYRYIRRMGISSD